MTELNNEILNQFRALIKQIQVDIDFSSGNKQMINMYRLRSIRNAFSALTKIKYKITSSDQLKGIAGLGKGSLKRIDEILKTGKLSEIKITEEDNKYLEYIANLEEIYGIGRKTAYDLFTKHNIKSIEELKDKYNKKEIELPDNIVKGLKYIGKIKEKIPRTDVDDIKEYLLDTLYQVNYNLFGTICGSYRRQTETSNDVDMIIVHPKAKTMKETLKHNYIAEFVDALKKKGFIVDSLTADDVPTKYMGIFKWKDGPLRRIDIRYIPYESYYSAILYFTGPKDFNRKMRNVALDMGYILNEYGLYDENEKLFKVTSEKDIFELLGMEYLQPHLRK